MRFSRILFDTYIKHFPKKFVDKQKNIIPKKIFGNRFGAPDVPDYNNVTIPEEYVYTEERPWEVAAQRRNDAYRLARASIRNVEAPPPRVRLPEVPDITEKPLSDDEWHIHRGDRVQVMAGKDKGRQGIVLRMVRERNWVFVEGLHCKHLFVDNGSSNYLTFVEQPLKVPDEVQLVDPKDLRPTSVEWRWDEHGERVRVSTRTGYIIPMPTTALETFDYKTSMTYRENVEKDTNADDALKRTFDPKLLTFEEELMELYGIDEKRKFGKTYWY